MTSRFHPSVESVLCDAGWTTNRRVEISHWVAELQKRGFEPTAEAIAILEEFGDLRLDPPINPEGAYGPEEVFFDPMFAASGRFDLIHQAESDLGTHLFPLAETHNSVAMLVISADGTFYCVSQFGIHLTGEDFYKAMDVLIRATIRPPLVHKWS